MRSLGTSEKREATKRAKSIFDEAQDLVWKKGVAPSATLASIEELYETAPIKPNAVSRKRAANCLRTVVGEDSKAKKVTLADLTADALMAYITAQKIKGRTSDGINSTLRQARSVFSKRARKYYIERGIVIPATLTGWLEAPLLPSAVSGYQPIDRVDLRGIDKAIESVRNTNPDLWLACSLSRRLGLRNDEIFSAVGEWVENTPSGPALVIRNRQIWRPKNGVSGILLLDTELASVLMLRDKDEFLVAPARTKTARYDIVYRDTSTLLRPFLQGRQKALYELRKEAGADTTTSQGLAAAKSMLRHKSQATTEKYYAAYLNPSQPIRPTT